jgi:NAD(P)-dependent dehydrogenase (short-subunit alcohol dehydrogenase family)
MVPNVVQSTSMDRLTGRRALVTGGTSGIGAATVRRLVAEGAGVVFTGRSAERAAPIEAETGATFVPADARAPAATRDAVEAAVATLGGLDVLVPNAGVLVLGTVAETSDEDWDVLFDTNLMAPLRYVQAALPHLGPGSAIVLLGSDAAIWGEQDIGAYSISKRCVHMLTRMLAVELGPRGIRTNAICPGDTAPGMVTTTRDRGELPDIDTWTKPPLGYSVEADDIAAAIAYLVSADARSTNGSELLVDGGMRAALRANTVWARSRP